MSCCNGVSGEPAGNNQQEDLRASPSDRTEYNGEDVVLISSTGKCVLRYLIAVGKEVCSGSGLLFK